MRVLVTRSIRPRIGSTSSNNLLSTASPARQTIFPPTRRKLTLSDAFTILLAPVFAAAFVADATLKDRKRREWDQRIAEVRADIEAIRERELRSWNTVQMKSVQVGVKYQRRGYATAVRATRSDPEEMYNQHAERQSERTPIRTASQDETAMLRSQAKREVGWQSETVLDPRVLANWQQYESLLASKLALELILHIRTGKSWLYRQPTEVLVDTDIFPESLDGLMVQLHRVNDALKQLNSIKRPGEVPYRLLTIPARDWLHEDIAKMAKACKEGEITIVQLVYGYASAIGSSKSAPKSTSYRALMDAFLTLDNESLAYTAMSALQNCQQRLNNADIGTMLFQYGHFKDSGRFSGFLRLLVKKEASCILRLTVPWEHVSVNDVRIPVPVDRNTRLIATSIRAALQCSMVQYAEAWTAILFQTGDREQLGSVMRHIITYYTEHCDWAYGSKWFQEIIKRAALITDENADELAKCVMRMLELCVACDKPEMYERLMNAVQTADIQPESINYSRPEFFSDRIVSIRRDWKARRKASLTAKDRVGKPSGCVEQAIRFQETLMQDDPTLQPYIGVITGLGMAEKTNFMEAKEQSQIQFRPFHTPTELLGGEQAFSKLAEELESKQGQLMVDEQYSSVKQENSDRQRIIELEKQLAESQKCNAELLEKLNNQPVVSQQSGNKDSKNLKIESGISHLHLLTDHQKLLQDYANLKATHQDLLESKEVQKGQTRQSRLSPKDQYATVLPDLDTAPVTRQSHIHSKRRFESQLG